MAVFGALWAFWLWNQWVHVEKPELRHDPQMNAEMLTQ